MTYPFENLVFEGGGVKGLAFCGALKVLEERGIITDVKGLAGSSAGAITAGLLACGYTSDEILDALKPKDFNEFKDDDFGIFRDVKRLMTEFGFYAGKEFHRWYGELLAKRAGHPDVTFGEIFDLISSRRNWSSPGPVSTAGRLTITLKNEILICLCRMPFVFP
jgi:NTE family protein